LTASQVVANDGRGNYATTSYSYSGGKLYLGSGVHDRKFAGFQIATTTAPDSITATYYNQGDSVYTPYGEQSDGYAQINHPFRKDVLDLSGNVQQRSFFRWDTTAHGNSTFVGLGRQMIENLSSDGTHRDKATDYTYSSTTDDLIQQVDYGEVTGNTDGTFSDTGSDKRTTNYTYAASSSVNMSLPTEKTLLDNNSATSSDSKLYYDSLAFGQVNVGNNTRQEDWISGTTYASTTKIYTGYGLVATSTDRNGNATSYVYEAYNLYPATTTNALLQKTQSYYNLANGKVKQSSDANSRLAKNLFDGFGRLTEIDQSSTSTPSAYATSTTYAYTDSTSTTSLIHRVDYLTGSNTVDTYDYYDGFNRVIQESKQTPTSGTYIVFDKTYNGVGLMASTSLPYFSSGSANTSPTATSNFYTNYLYDPLQRPLTISNAVGTMNDTYSKWTTTTSDPNGHIKDYILDAFGNLATVVEHLTSSNSTTTYSYDVLNNLATTTDGLSNVRHFTYDGLNRRLTSQDLHASSDTTYGTSTYAYDNQGNLTSETTPNGKTITRTYDTLGRRLTESVSGLTGNQITLTYDSCTNGIGYLCIAWSTSALTTNLYDILGNVVSATTTVSNLSYNMAYGYDRQGNVTNFIQTSDDRLIEHKHSKIRLHLRCRR
jgi:YD repeat-containing protein